MVWTKWSRSQMRSSRSPNKLEREDLANGLAFRYEIQLTRGEIRQAQRDLERHTRLAEELKLPSQIWHAAAHRTELMLLMGRFTEAAAGIDQALHRGMSAHPDEALHTAVIQRLLLFMQQGGPLEELRPPLEKLEADRSDDTIYSCLLARLDCELGQKRQAQARLDPLGRDGFGAVRHGQWLLTIGLYWQRSPPWWETRRDEDALRVAASVFRAGRWLGAYPCCVSRYLGLLAAALSRLDEAALFFRTRWKRTTG